ncbi:MAG: AAA family ATPase [Myxococcales bacterium]|nr:AAA family ATPase [Myxococcales bacterium]MDD9965521.1 AAA family ATPase [Myxococcales bacterium]
MTAAAKPVTLRLEAYAQSARRLVASAQALADSRKHAEVEPVHLLQTLADESDAARQALAGAGADPDDVLLESELCLRRLPRTEDGPAYLSPRLLDLLGRAEGEAAREGGLPVSAGHLLLAAAQARQDDAKAVLASCGASAPTLRAQLIVSERSSHPGRATDGPATSWGVDLTQRARQGLFDTTVGRDTELRRIMQVLARRGSHNPLLVGESGVGRHSVVQALCERIARDDVPTLLQAKRIVELSSVQLLSGGLARGEAEQRLERWLASVRDTGGEVIMYIRDLGTLLGERSASMMAHVLSSGLRQGGVQVIAAIDPTSHKRLLSSSDLMNHFVRIDVEAPDEAGTVAMLRARAGHFEVAHGLQITDPALVAAATLSRRYLRQAQLPKSALDLVDEAAARLRVEMQSVPRAIDERARRLNAIDVELSSLMDDGDEASQASYRQLSTERSALSHELEELRSRWQVEVDAIAQISQVKEEIAAVESQLADLPANSDRAGQLRTVTLKELQQRRADAEACLPTEGRLVRQVVEAADIAGVIADWTGVPVTRLMEGEAEKLLHMEARIGERVIGQARAVAAVSRAVRRGRVGLRDAKRPIGSFMFLGTSGVGKTELAKALAEFLFDDEAALTRIDMSEFMEKHTVARLLGSPPGYADSEEGGFLTEAVRRRPYSVLLFDEVEKAHPDVFNILLQVLDDGHLTDARGRRAHFSDCVILLTSNLGAHAILENAGTQVEGDAPPTNGNAQMTGTFEALPETVQQALRGHFRPEFLNRIDEIVVFDTLSRQDLAAILELQLGRLQRWLSPRGFAMTVTDEAKHYLVDLGYNPAFGARPLARVLQRELQDPLSELLLRDACKPGETLLVSLQAGTLRFEACKGSEPDALPAPQYTTS